MTVILDSANNGNDVTSTDTNTWSHTCTGSDLLLRVSVGSYDGGTDPVVPTATYDGVAMIQEETTLLNAGDANRLTTFYLAGPSTGANDVVVSTSTSQSNINTASTSYTAVDQTTPEGTAVVQVNSGASITLDVSSATGEMVVDSLETYDTTNTPGAGQTLTASNENGSGSDSVVCSEEAGSTTTTMSWSVTTADGQDKALIGVALKAAATADLDQFVAAARDDDDNEADAAYLEDENVDASVPVDTNFWIQHGIDTDGDAGSTDFEIEYREENETPYELVLVGATSGGASGVEVTYEFNSLNAANPGSWDTSQAIANLVDEDLGTYCRDNNDAHYLELTGNTCVGTDLGTITKVEIRGSWASNGANAIPELRPVFGGTTDGDNHDIVTSNTGQEWSPYFDITSDTNAPTWDWDDVADLELLITNNRSSNRIDLYQIEIRVTYTEPTVNNRVFISSSAEIADGVATTEHTSDITPPSGKAGDFTAGECWTTSNVSGGIDITADYFTLVQHCMQIATADVYDFRIRGLDTYTNQIQITATAGTTVTVGIASETDTALGSLSIQKELAVGIVSETDSALGPVTELADTTVVVTQATEVDTAIGPLTVFQDITVIVTQAVETDVALGPIDIFQDIIVTPGIASETDTAIGPVGVSQPITTVIVTQAEETDTALGPLDPGQATIVEVGVAAETDSALGTLDHYKALDVGIAAEIDTNQGVDRTKEFIVASIAEETDSALAATSTFQVILGIAEEVDSAISPIVIEKRVVIGAIAEEVDSTLTPSLRKEHVLGLVEETDTVPGAITVSHLVLVGLASEVDIALPITGGAPPSTGLGAQSPTISLNIAIGL